MRAGKALRKPAGPPTTARRWPITVGFLVRNGSSPAYSARAPTKSQNAKQVPRKKLGREKSSSSCAVGRLYKRQWSRCAARLAGTKTFEESVCSKSSSSKQSEPNQYSDSWLPEPICDYPVHPLRQALSHLRGHYLAETCQPLEADGIGRTRADLRAGTVSVSQPMASQEEKTRIKFFYFRRTLEGTWMGSREPVAFRQGLATNGQRSNPTDLVRQLEIPPGISRRSWLNSWSINFQHPDFARSGRETVQLFADRGRTESDPRSRNFEASRRDGHSWPSPI